MATNTETSIIDARKLDIDTLMSDSFQLDEYLSQGNRQRLELAGQHVDRDELESQVKMGEFLSQTGYSTPDTLAAGQTAINSLLTETTSKGAWDGMKEAWRNNNIDILVSDIRVAEMYGTISPDEAQKQVDALKAQRKETRSEGLASWLKAAAGIAPMAINTMYSGTKYGGAGAVGGAAIAAGGGQLGPQALLPEEVITVPAGAVAGFGVGMTMGSVKRAGEIETGLMYDELLSFKDEQGRGIDPTLAKTISVGVGTVNGLLEMVQIKDIIKTVPGGKKLLAKAQRDTITSLVKKKALLKVVQKGATRYVGNLATETGTEVAQEADNIIMGELAIALNNRLMGTDIPQAEREQIVARIVDTAKESAKAFAVVAAPGNILQTTADLMPDQAPAKPAEPTDPVKNISRITPAMEKITPRVRIEELGKVMVDTGMPEPKPRKTKEKQAKPLTPEEEFTAKQTEATFAATEEYEITPKLYIGNVTARMKQVFADMLGKSPDDVHGFLEGAYPTKRTKIKLTMDQARHLLVEMEADLQGRVDNNQLNTDADLARAHADWGDIKELRSKMGLPKSQEPFRVTRNKQTGTIVIENTAERIRKTTQKSQLDTVEMTEIDRINNVMRRMAKGAREGHAAGKKEARQAYAEMRYLQKQRELREKLISSIAQDVPENVDFFYREAIAGLQSQLDLKAKTEGKKAKKDSLRKLLADNPEKAADIPQDLQDLATKKDVAELSYMDLLRLNDEIKRLKHLGKLKSDLFKKQRAKALDAATKKMTANLEAAKPNIMPSVERANTLKPSRLFDMLDGMKQFAGEIFNFFYDEVNDRHNAELQNTDIRQKGMAQKLKELGLQWGDFTKKRIVGEFELTVDQLLGIYAGWKNTESQLAIRYGGIPIVKGKTTVYVECTDAIYAQIEAALSPAEKLWADTIITEYGENYTRMRNAVIGAENRDPGRTDNYTKMRRLNREYTSTEEEVLAELEARGYFRTIGLHKGFTIQRKDISPEFQSPIDLSLTKVWLGEIRKQEHYIAMAQHLKDMRHIANNKAFRAAVESRFGKPVLSTVDAYIQRMANPDFYKTFSDLESLSKTLRKHTAIAFIAGNISSIANQIPAIAMYWAHSSIGDILYSTMQAARHPMQSFDAAEKAHPQLAHTYIEREMEELNRVDPNAYKRIVDRVGRVGMYGIFAMDRAIRVIGINAVNNYGVRKGLSPNEAAHKAAMVTLLTQEAASPKDLARIYASSEFLNWFTMFTNQLNQIYNISTYDIPAAWHNRNYREAARSMTALTTMALCIWMIQHGELPDEPEEVAQALAENALAAVPLFGSQAVASLNGWTSQPAVLQATDKLVKAGVAVTNEEWGKVVENLALPLSIGTGYPYQATKELYDLLAD